MKKCIKASSDIFIQETIYEILLDIFDGEVLSSAGDYEVGSKDWYDEFKWGREELQDNVDKVVDGGEWSYFDEEQSDWIWHHLTEYDKLVEDAEKETIRFNS